MKKHFIISLVIGLVLLAIPNTYQGQEPKFIHNESTIDFNITDINLFDERIFFVYNLVNDGRFNVVNGEEDGVFLISVDPAYEGINLKDAFSDFKSQNAVQFSMLDKEQAAEITSEYKAKLPKDLVHSLMMDIYARSRDNDRCADAYPFCTDNGMYQFPAGTGTSSGENGPYYDCLHTTPNPAWYYMRIGNPGTMTIHMYSTPSYDIDFCCWGPFDDPVTVCPNGLTSSKVVSCSYSTHATEDCIIPSNAQTGKYYILVITNYSNQACNINFSKTAGSGTTDCSILPPLVDAGGPYCLGETITLTGNAMGGASYSWSGPGNWHATGASVTRPNCTMAMAGVYTCTITLNDQQSSATDTVVIYPNVTSADFSASSSSACVGETIQFAGFATTNPSGQQIQSYTWTFGDGSSGSGQNVTHTYTQPGTYSVKLTTSTGGHCTAEKTKTVTIHAVPDANAGEEQTVSYGATAQLQGSGGNGSGNFNYHWEPSNMVDNPNIANPQTVRLTETQSFVLTVTNPANTECNSYDAVTVNVTGSAMTATGSASAEVICAGGSTQLNVNAQEGTGQYTYSWSPTTGLNNPAIARPVATPPQTTTYTCTVSDGITTQSVPVTITVHAMPVADAGEDRTVSYGHTALLEGSAGAGTFSYHWEPANMVLNPNAQNTTTLGLTAATTFTLTVTNPDHTECTSTAQVTISIEGSDMTIGPSASPSAICEGETTAQLNAHAGGGTGSFTYSWSPETGLDDPHSATPIASPNATTTYSCTVSDGFSTLTQNVTVTVHHPETGEETHYTCANEPFLWHGQYYADADDYIFDTLTNNGCRKTLTLHLRHYPIYDETTITEAICSGDTYDFFGTPYGQVNTTPSPILLQGAHTLRTVHGCDSIVRLNLTVYPENKLTVDSVEICPEQTYEFYGTAYNQPTEVDYTDHDIHGCDSVVRLVLSVGEYFIPNMVTQYIAYDDQPSFTWDVNGTTYTTPGLHVDTLETDACKAIYRLDLNFMQVPDDDITIDTACDHYTWRVLGVDHQYTLPQGAVAHQFNELVQDNLAPYHYEDGRPSYKNYRLNLQMYKTLEADSLVDGVCNSFTWQFGYNGESETYTADGNHTKTIQSTQSHFHCDSIVTLKIRNMRYNPNPVDSIFPTEPSTIMSRHYDTAYVITNTEFFSFIYDFYVSEKGSSKWDGCIWEKSDWCDWDIVPYTPQGETVNKCCKVYVGQRYEVPVKLTCKMWNDCMSAGDTLVRTLYLKSSFLGVDEQQSPVSNGDVTIIPNPNNGQMQLNFENMEGRVNVKVYDMTGRLIDDFETPVLTHSQSCNYHMKAIQDGVYFFIIANEQQVLTRKVVLLR